jgi:hypothetical protein
MKLPLTVSACMALWKGIPSYGISSVYISLLGRVLSMDVVGLSRVIVVSPLP